METQLITNFLMVAMNPRTQIGGAFALMEQSIHEKQAVSNYLPDVGISDSYSQTFNRLVDVVALKLDVSEKKAQGIASRVINEREITHLSSQGFETQNQGYDQILMLSPHDTRRDLTPLVQQELKEWPAILLA